MPKTTPKLTTVQQVRLTDEQTDYLRALPGSMAEAVRGLIDRAIIVPCPACNGTGLNTVKGSK